jgi:hypothetical protein
MKLVTGTSLRGSGSIEDGPGIPTGTTGSGGRTLPLTNGAGAPLCGASASLAMSFGPIGPAGVRTVT